MSGFLQEIIKIVILLFIIISGTSTIYSFKNNHFNAYFLPEVYSRLTLLPFTIFVLIILISMVVGFVLKYRINSLVLLLLSSIFGIIIQIIFIGVSSSYGEYHYKLLTSLINFYGLASAFIYDFFGSISIMLLFSGFITGIFLFLGNAVGRSIRDLIFTKTIKN